VPPPLTINLFIQALEKMQILLKTKDITRQLPEQKVAMIYILECQKDVVVIHRTKGDKSMLAIVPSMLEASMANILVLLLNSLIMDYEQRLGAMSVPYQTYQVDKELNSRDNLILVSADKSQMSHWCTHWQTLLVCKMIAHIVVDKAHIPMITKCYHKTLEHFYNVQLELV
jgi:hypothetical protein